MTRYDYCHVGYTYQQRPAGQPDTVLEITCTDPTTLRALAARVKPNLPRAQVHWTNDLSGEPYQCTFHYVQRQGGALPFSMFKSLCTQGWEPLEVRRDQGPAGGAHHYHLRRQVPAAQP